MESAGHYPFGKNAVSRRQFTGLLQRQYETLVIWNHLERRLGRVAESKPEIPTPEHLINVSQVVTLEGNGSVQFSFVN